MSRVILTIIILLIITACDFNNTRNSNTDFVGVWQFPEKMVWVQIKPNDQVFQCRIDVDGSVIKSMGELNSNNTIRWQQVWQPDQIRRNGDTIYLKGIHGDFGFDKTDTQMVEECQNPIS